MTSFSRSPIDIELLDRYITGSTTHVEDIQVLEWLAQHPDHARLVESLRTVSSHKTGREVQTDSRAWLAWVEARMDLGAETLHRGNITRGVGHAQKDAPKMQRSTPKLSSPAIAAFATITFALFAVFGLWTYNTSSKVITARSGDASATIYTTNKGERARLTLPDGSTAMLSVGSQLEVPTDFGKNNRTLRLKGEGLFTVSHAAGVPFVVLTDNTSARVLGTTFAVRRYTTDSVTKVSIQDGKVSVANKVLTAQQQAVISSNGSIRLTHATPAAFTFATGVLTLSDMPLSDAIVELNRWYDADIRIGDSMLASKRIGGTFVAGSLSDLMDMLQWTLSLHVVRDGRMFTLYRRQS